MVGNPILYPHEVDPMKSPPLGSALRCVRRSYDKLQHCAAPQGWPSDLVDADGLLIGETLGLALKKYVLGMFTHW